MLKFPIELSTIKWNQYHFIASYIVLANVTPKINTSVLIYWPFEQKIIIDWFFIEKGFFRIVKKRLKPFNKGISERENYFSYPISKYKYEEKEVAISENTIYYLY